MVPEGNHESVAGRHVDVPDTLDVAGVSVRVAWTCELAMLCRQAASTRCTNQPHATSINSVFMTYVIDTSLYSSFFFWCQYSDGEPPTGASNASGECKIATWLHRLLWTPNAIHSTATDYGKLVTLVTGKRRSLLLAGDDDKVFMTRSLNVTPKTTEHLIVCTRKPEAQVSTRNQHASPPRQCNTGRPCADSIERFLRNFLSFMDS